MTRIFSQLLWVKARRLQRWIKNQDVPNNRRLIKMHCNIFDNVCEYCSVLDSINCSLIKEQKIESSKLWKGWVEHKSRKKNQSQIWKIFLCSIAPNFQSKIRTKYFSSILNWNKTRKNTSLQCRSSRGGILGFGEILVWSSYLLEAEAFRLDNYHLRGIPNNGIFED